MGWEVGWPRVWWTRVPVWCDTWGLQPAPSSFLFNWNPHPRLGQQFSNELRCQCTCGAPRANSIIQIRSNVTPRKSSCVISTQYNPVITHTAFVVKTSHTYSGSSRYTMNLHFSIASHRHGHIMGFSQRNVSGKFFKSAYDSPSLGCSLYGSPPWDRASVCQSPGVGMKTELFSNLQQT